MNDNISTLSANLVKLRENFDQRLAARMQRETQTKAFVKPSSQIADEEALAHLEKVVEFRKWFRFFR